MKDNEITETFGRLILISVALFIALQIVSLITI